MALDDDIALLAKVDMFREFPREQLRLLAFGTEREFMAEGTDLFRDGAEAEGGYVVAAGRVDLIAYRDNRQIVLHSLYEGDLIGAMALIAPRPHIGHAVARTDSEVLFISRNLFRRMLKAYPETAAHLAVYIGEHARRMAEQMERVRRRMEKIPDLAPARRNGSAQE